MLAFKNPVQILQDRQLSQATQVQKTRNAASYLRAVSSGATLSHTAPAYVPRA